jgi:hypothetical protein
MLAVGPFHELEIGAGDAIQARINELAEAGVRVAHEDHIEAVIDR